MMQIGFRKKEGGGERRQATAVTRYVNRRRRWRSRALLYRIL